jgi:uncharacterized membrane protein
MSRTARFLLRSVLVAAAMGAIDAPAADAKTLYQFVPIVQPHAGVLYPGDMNDRGTIVGSIEVEDGVYPGIVIHALGDAVIVRWPGTSSSGLNGVNDRGDSVGTLDFPGVTQHAFVRWADGRVVDLHPEGAAGYSVAAHINVHGVIVGAGSLSSWSHARARPVVWRDGVYEELPSLGKGGAADALNDAGEIVGVVQDASLQNHAARWIEGRLDVLPGLGPGGAEAGEPLALNAQGLVVGRCTLADGSTEACAWTPDGVVHDLGREAGTFSSQARDVNDAGTIVGADFLPQGGSHAVLFRNGQAMDLNTLLMTPAPSALSWATAIDRAGRIQVTLADGTQGLLLPWTVEDTEATPETE